MPEALSQIGNISHEARVPLAKILTEAPQRTMGLLPQYQTRGNFGVAEGMNSQNKNNWRGWVLDFASQGLTDEEKGKAHIICLGGVDLAEPKGYISQGFNPGNITSVERNINKEVKDGLINATNGVKVEFDSLGRLLSKKDFYVDIASFDFCGEISGEVLDCIRNTKFWNGRGRLMVNLRHRREKDSIQELLESMTKYLDSNEHYRSGGPANRINAMRSTIGSLLFMNIGISRVTDKIELPEHEWYDVDKHMRIFLENVYNRPGESSYFHALILGFIESNINVPQNQATANMLLNLYNEFLTSLYVYSWKVNDYQEYSYKSDLDGTDFVTYAFNLEDALSTDMIYTMKRIGEFFMRVFLELHKNALNPNIKLSCIQSKSNIVVEIGDKKLKLPIETKKEFNAFLKERNVKIHTKPIPKDITKH